MQVLIENTSSDLLETYNDKVGNDYYISGPMLEYDRKNRNGRKYPRDVMLNELNRFNSEFVMRRRAVGELNHPCFSPSARALTTDGWKYISNVTKEDQVYTINLSNGQVKIRNPLNIVNQPYQGKMIRIKGKHIDTKVTPQHRFVIQNRNGNRSFMTAQEIYDRINVEQKKLNAVILRESDGIEDLDIENEVMIGDTLVNRQDLFALIGLFLAEGCGTDGRVRLYQRKIEQSNKIFDLINRLPFNFTHFQSKTGTNVWTSTDKELKELLCPLGNCYTKYVPSIVKDSTDKEALRSFFEWYALGDGRLRPCGKIKDVFSVSERLIDDVCGILVKLGYCVNKSTLDTSEDYYMFADHLIEGKNKSPLHFASLIYTKGTHIEPRYLKVTEEDYDGTIHCLETEEGSFFVEDNGLSFWTGNSPSTPTIDYFRVSHYITELTDRGDGIVYGKAKILDTGPGKIVKTLMDENIQLGVSSRATGSLKKQGDAQVVQEDFRLSTIDIVADPSAHSAFVDNIRENFDNFLEEGIIQEGDTNYLMEHIEQYNKEIEKRMQEAKIQELFEDLITGFKKSKLKR